MCKPGCYRRFCLVSVIPFLIIGILISSFPVSAVDDATMLYNGVELPNIDTVWSDKDTFPYAQLFSHSAGVTDVYFTNVPWSKDGSFFVFDGRGLAFRYSDGVWEPYLTLNGTSAMAGSVWTLFWSNVDILNSDGSVFLDGSDPVPVGGSGTESSIVSVSVSSLTSSAYPGSTVHFDAAVSGTGSYDSSVTWSVSGATSAGSFIDGFGNLTIADNETSAQLTVTATSVQDTSVSGSASIVVLPFPNVDDLTIVPGKETALQGVAFVQQFSIAYKDGTAYTGPSPVWSFEVTPPDSPFPDLDGEYGWVTISDTGILSISADAPADYMVVLTAKFGNQYLTGGRVFISTETNDYLKDIINGTEEQKGQADSFGDKTDEQFADLEEDVSLIDQVTMPNIDDIDLNIDTQVSGDGMTALAMLLGLFMNSQVISTSMTFAFLFALVAFVIFGKR